jgi:hypothetical protein
MPCQLTRAAPLDFDPEGLTCNGACEYPLQGGRDHPVVYKDMVIGKNITLNWMNNIHISQYQAVFQYPEPVQHGMVSAPVAYLTGDFTRYWAHYYDTSGNPHTGELSIPNTNPAGTEFAWNNFPNCAAAISTTAAADWAFAIYTCKPGSGHTALGTRLEFTNVIVPGGGTCDTCPNTSVLVSKYTDEDIAPPILNGTSQTLTTYIITGTLDGGPDDVRNAMNALYVAGY